jgi:hypothetical protein
MAWWTTLMRLPVRIIILVLAPSLRRSLAGCVAGPETSLFLFISIEGIQMSGKKGAPMIRAILRKGKIQPLDELPENWRDGQELIVEGYGPSDDPSDIRKWHEEFVALSAQIPAEDHERMAAALAEQDRLAKDLMRRDMRLD